MAETLPSLTEALRERLAPLLIGFEDGCIVAASYDYEGPYDFNIRFHHPEGDILMGFDAPEEMDEEEALSSFPQFSRFLPGFEIYEGLTEADRQHLGLRHALWGASPAHDGHPAITLKATGSELDALLVARGLPFRVQR